MENYNNLGHSEIQIVTENYEKITRIGMRLIDAHKKQRKHLQSLFANVDTKEWLTRFPNTDLDHHVTRHRSRQFRNKDA